MKLTAQLRENPAAQLKATPTPAPAAPPAEAAAEQSAEDQPAAESTDASAPAAETETEQPQEPTEGEQPPADTEDDQETEGDGPITPVTGKRAHLRLPEEDKVGRLAAAMMKRNRDMTMPEAVARASEQLGVTPAAPKSAPEAKETVSNMPATLAEVDTLKKSKREEYRKAMAEVRLDDAANLQAEIDDLTVHRFNLERNADREAVATEAKFNKDFDASAAKATDLYAFASDQASPGGKRMLEIERQLRENNDPLYYSASKPLVIAQMVAAELKIAPKSKNAPAKPAVPPVAPAAKKGVVATGGSRTTPPPVNQKPEIQAKIAAVKNEGDLRKLRLELGLQT